MNKRVSLILLSIILAVSLGLHGCGPAQKPAELTPGTPAEPKVGKDIVMAMNSEPKTLDPHKSNDGPSMITWKHMFNTLVVLDVETREVKPSLAKSWEFVDSKTLRFHLRDDVKFHDGSKFTANDVAFSIARLIDPATASPAAFLLRVIDNIKVDNDYTVTFSLKEEFAPILYHFTHGAASIVPEAVVKAKGDDFAKEPVGSGPFKFVSYTKGDKVQFAKNPDYWGGEPVPDTVTIRIIPEPATQVAELESGGIHIAFNIPTIEVERLRQNSDINVMTVMGWGVQGLVFNLEREPFGDIRVRHAMNYALDKEAIVRHVEQGLGKPSGQILSEVVFGYNPNVEPYPFNVDKAKQLLADAGFPNGFETRILVWNMERFVRFAEAVQGQFAKVGIDAKLDVIEFGAALEMAYRGDFDITLMQWGTTTLDGDYSYYSLIHSDNWGAAGNWGFYKNDEVDELVMTARTNPNADVRLASYQQAAVLVREDAPWVFSHFPMAAYAARTSLKDVKIPVSWVNVDVTRAYVQEK